MNRADEKNHCWLCGKQRSGNASREAGWIAQICRRPKCVESKRLLKRILQKVSELDDNAGSLAFEVHHYHYVSQRSGADPDRTRLHRFELPAEAFPKNPIALHSHSVPAHAGEFTELYCDISSQRFTRSV